MSTEENKALVRRWMEEGFKEVEAYSDYLHEDYTLYDARKTSWPAWVGQEGLAKLFREYLPEHPTFSIIIDDIIGEGNTVATRATRFEQGKPISNEVAFYRIADGKIVEDWVCATDIEE